MQGMSVQQLTRIAILQIGLNLNGIGVQKMSVQQLTRIALRPNRVKPEWNWGARNVRAIVN